MSENKYITEWKDHVLKAASALREDDHSRYEKEIELMSEAYEAYKKDNALSYENETSFGVAREIFETALPELFVNDKKTVKKVLNTIREDKNLQAQFMFFEALKKYKTEYDLKNYVNEAYELAQKNIDFKTIKNSNRKFYSVLRENGIKAKDFLDEDKLNFYRDCNKILSEKRNLSNISQMNETYNRVSKFVETMAKEKEEENNISKPLSIKEFVTKLNANLTESEKEILNTLLDSNNEDKRKAMFEDYKKKCLNKIKTTMIETKGEEKERLKKLYENLSKKTYNKETIFEEMVKLLEVSEIFND